MSDSAKENVVRLDDYGQLRRGQGDGPGAEALREVRELAATRLKQHLGVTMQKVEDALFERAEKAESSQVQASYLKAMQELRIVGKDVEDGFVAGFNARFEQGMPRATRGAGFGSVSDQNPAHENAVEEDMAIAAIVTKVREECGPLLGTLDRRIGFLLHDPDLEEWQNPLGPEALCATFREAVASIEADLGIRLVVFRMFEQHVVCHLDALYTELNQHLSRLGVLPEGGGAARSAARGDRQPANDTGHDVQASGAPGTDALAHPVGSGEQRDTGAGADPAEERLLACLAALTCLQQDDPVSANAMGAGFDVDPDALRSGLTNILHVIKNSTAIGKLGAGGDANVEIVALLFDYILDDPNVPEPMRALIGRLQVPVLKVALLDREFFTRKTHPARQLVNRLALTAVGWDAQQGHDAIYQKVASIVQTVVDGFFDNTEMFESLLRDLDEFLCREEERAEVRAERSARVMEGQERLEVAKHTTLEEIEPRVSDAVSLDFVREFISTHWKNLLFITSARHGKESDAWKQAVATMDDLIWSVKPKHSVEDRRRLVAMRPALLNNLRMGMERLSIPVTERDEFIARLVYAYSRTAISAAPGNHAQSAATPERAQQADAAPRTPGMAPGEPDRRRATPRKTGSAKTATTRPVNDQFHERVKMLTTGAWVEFNGPYGRATRAKLSWVSPITGTYLFTDRQGLKAGNYTLDELAALLREGRARVLNSTPLMDRAVGTVLKQYQPK